MDTDTRAQNDFLPHRERKKTALGDAHSIATRTYGRRQSLYTLHSFSGKHEKDLRKN